MGMSPETSQISNMLGLYKAEWLNGKLFELFNEPQYFGELKTKRPCVLIGGRGTGKTTVLRGLSYQGQFALHNKNVASIKVADFYGIYYRVNTNRVTAFDGPELTHEQWSKYFAHYLNLIFCLSVLEFVEWYCVQTGEVIILPPEAMRKIAISLALAPPPDLRALAEGIEIELARFEASLNSIGGSQQQQTLSLQGAPIDHLTEALTELAQFRNKQFFFLIDEFENLLPYQQRILNTLIKHAGTGYTFKIGVRELGWRERATLNPSEQLTSPADYARINIGDVMTGTKFANFAADVVGARLALHQDPIVGRSLIKTLFPRLTEFEEASRLLDSEQKAEIIAAAKRALGDDPRLSDSPIGKLAFAKYWAETHEGEITLKETFLSILDDDPVWQTRLNNYYYSYLFTIRKRKAGIRKYYCGWDVFLLLANGNIRYLLELVHSAFSRHVGEGGDATSSISFELQTEAAQYVGKKNLDELQGLSVDGASLTKLLLSLGRIFQLLANDPAGHTPEVTQFCLAQDAPTNDAVIRLLQSAVMHLALIRSPGNKLADQSDTKEYDYMVHPVFAPFFVFSYRKKRKIPLQPALILKLISNPKEGIAEVMRLNNRTQDSPLPDQLELFGAFYA